MQSEKVTSEQLLTVTRGAPSHVPCSTVEPPDNVVLCEKLQNYDRGCSILVHDMLKKRVGGLGEEGKEGRGGYDMAGQQLLI